MFGLTLPHEHEHGGARDAAHARRRSVATSTGKVLCCRLDLSSRAGHLCGYTYLGPRGATMGYFKDHEVGANCIALLIVLCLWEGGGC